MDITMSSIRPTRVEVLTGVQRRRRWTPERKLEIAKQTNEPGRDEVLDANLFNTISQAQEAADARVADYNEFRPHDSLGDMTPMEYGSRAFKPGISSFGLST